MNTRETFQSRLGFLLVSAGCAVGIGNVWKFPYVAGANGGGVFVLLYLLFLLIMGVPILTMELAVGRASRQGAVGGYRALERKGQKWHVHGWICILGCYLLTSYYPTVSGWMLSYFFKFATGAFADVTGTDAVGAVFSSLLASPWEMLLWTGITVVAGFAVCSLRLQKGVERVSKFMMLGLLLLIVALSVHSLTLDGAAEGLRFYLLPNLAKAREAGIGNVVTAAMTQAFFTLSLGIASMEIFGSYMTKEKTVTGEAIRICALDTFVALTAGVIIFPACFSFGIEPSAGPPLIFQALPNMFTNVAGGRLWGALFFLFMTFAAFTTVIAVFQNLIAACEENLGWSKRKAALLNFLLLLAANLPCILGYNRWSDRTLLGGRGIMDAVDFLVSNLLLPVGTIVYLLFCTTKLGWGFDRYLAECNTGSGIKMPKWIKPYLQFVLPVLILIIFLTGLI